MTDLHFIGKLILVVGTVLIVLGVLLQILGRVPQLVWLPDDGWIPVAPEDEPATLVPFAVGDRVAHASWGDGTVQRVERDALTVLFDTEGYRTLATKLIVADDLLQPVESARAVSD